MGNNVDVCICIGLVFDVVKREDFVNFWILDLLFFMFDDCFWWFSFWGFVVGNVVIDDEIWEEIRVGKWVVEIEVIVDEYDIDLDVELWGLFVYYSDGGVFFNGNFKFEIELVRSEIKEWVWRVD